MTAEWLRERGKQRSPVVNYRDNKIGHSRRNISAQRGNARWEIQVRQLQRERILEN